MNETLKYLSQQENLSAADTSVLLRNISQYQDALDFLKAEGYSSTVFTAIIAEKIKALKEELKRRGVEAEWEGSAAITIGEPS